MPVPPSKAEKARIEQGEEGTSNPITDQVMEQRSSAGGGVVEVHKFSHTVIRVSHTQVPFLLIFSNFAIFFCSITILVPMHNNGARHKFPFF